MLKIATNTVGNFVFPEDMAESEAVLSISDAYIEIMADATELTDSMLYMREHLYQ